MNSELLSDIGYWLASQGDSNCTCNSVFSASKRREGLVNILQTVDRATLVQAKDILRAHCQSLHLNLLPVFSSSEVGGRSAVGLQ